MESYKVIAIAKSFECCHGNQLESEFKSQLSLGTRPAQSFLKQLHTANTHYFLIHHQLVAQQPLILNRKIASYWMDVG